MTEFEDGLLLRLGDITEELKVANRRLKSIDCYLEDIVESLDLLTDWAHKKRANTMTCSTWPAFDEWMARQQKYEEGGETTEAVLKSFEKMENAIRGWEKKESEK